MPDILLIQPPIRDFYLTAKRTIPYGLACIAAQLIREGYSVEIIDGLATGKSKKVNLPPEMLVPERFLLRAGYFPFLPVPRLQAFRTGPGGHRGEGPQLRCVSGGNIGPFYSL